MSHDNTIDIVNDDRSTIGIMCNWIFPFFLLYQPMLRPCISFCFTFLDFIVQNFKVKVGNWDTFSLNRSFSLFHECLLSNWPVFQEGNVESVAKLFWGIIDLFRKYLIHNFFQQCKDLSSFSIKILFKTYILKNFIAVARIFSLT